MSFTRSASKKQTDWVAILLYLALVAIGFGAIYTSNYTEDMHITWRNLLDYKIGKHILFMGVSFIIVLIIQLFDRKFFISISPLLYLISVILLIGVLFFGEIKGGSRSWYKIASFSFQPSELAKVGTALMIAYFLSDFNVSVSKLKDFLITAAIIITPMILILIQSDAGTALVYTSLILVLYREGLSPWFLVLYGSVIGLFILTLIFTKFDPITLEVLQNGYKPLSIGLGVVTSLFALFHFKNKWIGTAIVAAICLLFMLLPFLVNDLILLIMLIVAFAAFTILYFVSKRNAIFLFSGFFTLSILYVQTVSFICTTVLQPYQLKRILILVNIISDSRGAGYNLEQSKIAIGSGGWTGKGFLEGNYVHSGFVPEVDTDFIFCNIGEEFGYVGSIVVIGLFLMLLLRIAAIAERQKSKFTRIYAYCVASMIFFHFFINIGMDIGLAPVIGIPLPLISYGGSSFLGFTILIFILIKLDSEKNNVVR